MEKKEIWRTILNLATVVINAILTTFFASCTFINF